MSFSYRLLAIPAVISALTLQLSACGEGSNNLKDPTTNTTTTITNCSDDTNNQCTSGQFIDEPVVGLNYECDKVKSITDSEGFFSCPDNSMVSFYLQSSQGGKRINLGKYRVKPLGDLAGNKLNVLLQITPRDLLGYKNVNIETETPVGKQVTNILRVLQALDSDGYVADNQVVNRIVLSESDKSKLASLSRDLEVADFAQTDALETALAPVLTALNKKMPVNAEAIERFKKSLPVLQAGLYEVLPFAVLKSDPGQKAYSGMIGFPVGGVGSEKLMEGIVMLVDRDGKSIGIGAEWKGVASDSDLSQTENNVKLQNQLVQRFIIDQKPKFLKLASEDLGFAVDGSIKPDFKLLDPDDGSILHIKQGVMEKGSLSGSEFFYRNVYSLAGSESVPTKNLGLWERRNALNNVTFTGTVNMNKTRDISPYLDPAIWRIEPTVEINTTPIFPLHLKLTLRDSDTNNALCDPELRGCLVGEMGISILANGNIISDRDNNCNQTLTADFQDQDGTQEHRLGTISAAFKSGGQSYISPIMLVGSWANDLPDADPWKKFYGLQIGMTTTAGGPKVKINVSNAVSKLVAIVDNQSEDSTDAARWVNYVKTFQFIHKNHIPAVPVETTQGAIAKSRLRPVIIRNPNSKF